MCYGNPSDEAAALVADVVGKIKARIKERRLREEVESLESNVEGGFVFCARNAPEAETASLLRAAHDKSRSFELKSFVRKVRGPVSWSVKCGSVFWRS